MISLFFRNLLFTILLPGTVAGLVPYLIAKNHSVSFQITSPLHLLGVIIFMIGFVLMVHCIFRFAIEGRGTLAPVDATKVLVVTGLYRYLRNPMYLGVITMLLGESIYIQSVIMWIYILIVFIAFNIFIFWIEEPRLKRDFGDEYIRYCQKVRRWI